MRTGSEDMKAFIGSFIIAALMMCGPLYVAIPVMAGDEATLTRAQVAEAQRKERIRVQWEKLMAQARAQQDQMARWRRANLRLRHAHTKSTFTKEKNQIAAELR
jgi:hypothetical protein